MLEENWKEFVEKKHQEYKKIGCVECPAFGNEKIYFNRHGFNHLLRKEGIPRSRYEQHRRTALLPYAVKILSDATRSITYSTNIEENCLAQFWTFHSTIDSKKIKIVVRQLGTGRKHFFSIYDKP